MWNIVRWGGGKYLFGPLPLDGPSRGGNPPGGFFTRTPLQIRRRSALFCPQIQLLTPRFGAGGSFISSSAAWPISKKRRGSMSRAFSRRGGPRIEPPPIGHPICLCLSRRRRCVRSGPRLGFLRLFWRRPGIQTVRRLTKTSRLRLGYPSSSGSQPILATRLWAPGAFSCTLSGGVRGVGATFLSCEGRGRARDFCYYY